MKKSPQQQEEEQMNNNVKLSSDMRSVPDPNIWLS